MFVKEFETQVTKLDPNGLIKATSEAIRAEKYFLDTSIADSLITNINLRELWITNCYQGWFESLRKPLLAHQQAIFKQKVSNQYFRYYIDNIQEYYGVVANESFSYEMSLKNTEHLKEYQDADKLC